jgi:fluoride exporter
MMPWRGGNVPARTAALPRLMASAPIRVTLKEPFRVPEPAAVNAASSSGLADVGLPPGSAGPSPPGRARLALPRPDGRTVAAIFVGGALGTLARAALEEAFPHAATAWPWPTFGVNVAAAFLLGYFVTRLQERLPLSSYRRPLLGTGICGGLSTFSTMELEILKMLSAHAYGLAIGYAAAGIAAGYAALHLATALVRRVRVRR